MSECGYACLAMVASFHGLKTNLASLRLKREPSLRGATLTSLIAASDGLNLAARPVRASVDELVKLRTPCILHWTMSHYVVLRSASRNRYIVHDPAKGVRRYTRREVADRFTGIALELTPMARLRPRNEHRTIRISDLWSRIEGLGASISQTLLLSVLVQLFALASPFYLQLVVDEVLARGDTELLSVLALGFSAIVIMDQATRALRARLILHAGNILGFQLVSNLSRHLLRLPMSWFESRNVGDVVTRFASTAPLRDLLTEGLVGTAIDGLMAISTLGLMMIYSPPLCALVLGAATLYAAIRMLMFRQLRRREEQNLASVAAEHSHFVETVRSMQSIRVLGKEVERFCLWQERYAAVIGDRVALGKLRLGFEAIRGVVFGLLDTVVVFLAASHVIDGKLTIGMLFAFMSYKQHFIGRTGALVERLIDYRLLGLHLERVSDIGLATPDPVFSAEPAASAAPDSTPRKPGAIRLDKVSFRYGGDDPWILRDVSFAISSGEMISIVGASGSGKSTLLKLILGLTEPASGRIAYRGVPIRRFGLRAYRQRIGTVLQNDTLVGGSIADNISFFDIEADVARIREVAAKASIDDDIMAMPMRYESLVGDMGCGLSAGQRQRLLLARALYRDPEIMVLDEGTAHLDPKTEARILAMLKKEGRTCICVAHREQVIAWSDRTLRLESGSIAELVSGQLRHPATGRAVVSRRRSSCPGRNKEVT